MENVLAHIVKSPSDGGKWLFQTNESHQSAVAEMAERFAAGCGLGRLGRIAGWLHDRGKEQRGFQQYLRRASGYEPGLRAARTPHAAVGAAVAMKLYPKCPMPAEVILGHHAGMKDQDEFRYTMQETAIPADVSVPASAPDLQPMMPAAEPSAKDIHHLQRLLFSCLVDADYLDTEAFMNHEHAAARSCRRTLAELRPLLDNYLARLQRDAAPTPVNAVRREVQQCCAEAASGAPGFYSLTVPTGGGKTLSSLLWAIRHAEAHGKTRIIIAIPYTSIIVQTAETLRRIFGEENVLEHHSNALTDSVADASLRLRLQLATENWDSPIIVTTNVQLFESMFTNRPAACRKLHNLCNSVLILDEVQTLPRGFLQPIVDALSTYGRLFGLSVLFTTASQPVLTGKHRGANGMPVLKGLEAVREIIPERMALHEVLRRVTISFDDKPVSYDEMASRLTTHRRVLCVVNTRRDAGEIYSRLPDEGLTLHLSRMMCPAHIAATIARLKAALKDDSQTVVRVVATQLIEAGVDIDFPVVYRQEAGLDAILQAAGRCNREGLLPVCTARVFRLEGRAPRGEMAEANNARRNLKSVDDWLAPATVRRYFEMLYAYTDSCDVKHIGPMLNTLGNIAFKRAAEAFRLIDDAGRSLIVNYGEAAALVERLRAEGPGYALMKQLGQYMVTVREADFRQMQAGGLLEEIVEGIFYVPERAQYDARRGLCLDNHWLEEILIL